MKKHQKIFLYYFLTLKKGHLNYKNSENNTILILKIKDQHLPQQSLKHQLLHLRKTNVFFIFVKNPN